MERLIAEGELKQALSRLAKAQSTDEESARSTLQQIDRLTFEFEKSTHLAASSAALQSELEERQGAHFERAQHAQQALNLIDSLLNRVPSEENKILLLVYLDQTANALKVLKQYSKARPLLEKALTLQEQLFEHNSPEMEAGLNNLALLHQLMEQPVKALPLFERVLKLRKQNVKTQPLALAETEACLAKLYGEADNIDEAIRLYSSALHRYQEVDQTQTPPVIGELLCDLAQLYERNGELDNMLSFYEQSFFFAEGQFNREHHTVENLLTDLATLHQKASALAELYAQHEPSKQLNLHRRCVDFRDKVFEKYRESQVFDDHTVLYEPRCEQYLRVYQQTAGKYYSASMSATTLQHQAELLYRLAEAYEVLGNLDEALPLYERALGLMEKALGNDNSQLHPILRKLVAMYEFMAEPDRAVALYEQYGAVYEAALSHAGLANDQLLNDLAELYLESNKPDEALVLYERALKFSERYYGKNDNTVRNILEKMARQLESMFEYDEALPLYERILNIDEKRLPEDSLTVLALREKLEFLYENGSGETFPHDLEKNLETYRLMLANLEETLGEKDRSVPAALVKLAMLYKLGGKYEQALPLYQRALNIRERVFGANSPSVASVLSKLTELYMLLGDYKKALPLGKRSLAIRQKLFCKSSRTLARSMHNLSVLYRLMGDYKKALPLCEDALVIREEVFGKSGNMSVASTLTNYALLCQSSKEYDKSASLFKRTLALQKSISGSESPMVAATLNHLALLHDEMELYSSAASYQKQALTIWFASLGKESLQTRQSMLSYFRSLVNRHKENRQMALDDFLFFMNHHLTKEEAAAFVQTWLPPQLLPE
ncbi:MAG: tetratricopeptide repeat protein [Gammaproteobacteria bacterium]|nr:tetratricopeptide repeat protein [Gammaproteobacteria bacterium]